MVLLKELGKDLDNSYVVIRIDRDVRFIDEIKDKARTLDEIKIKAWGNAINLAVRLALQVTQEVLQNFSIECVEIGTMEDVEMKNGKVRPLSWMEIVLKK
ncbi:MAG: hypothetical protein ACTSUE_07070 [Promethearchaeota archaeon]